MKENLMAVVRTLCVIVFLLTVLSAARAQDWTRVSDIPSSVVASLLVRGDTVYAGTDSAIYWSGNGGATWIRSATLPSSSEGWIPYVDAITVFDGRVFAGTGGLGVLTSSDKGQTWHPLNDGFVGLGSNYISGFVERGGFLYAGTAGAGVFQLQGTTWHPFGDLGNMQAGNVEFLGIKGDTLVAGAGGNGYVWYAPGSATAWNGVQVAPLHIEAFIIYSVVSFNGILYAGSTYGVHQSTDGGSTWTFCGSGIPANRRVRLLPFGDTLYATVSVADTRWYTLGSGESWEFVEGTFYTYAEAVANGRLFAARGDGLWRRDVPTSVSPPSTVPSGYALEQNYPNPFSAGGGSASGGNPTTTIGYSIGGVVALSGAHLSGVEGRMSRNVRLAVYDILGREVARLVDEPKAPGNYEVTFDGSGLASGVYMYRLTAGAYTESRKMVLIR
jgi:hypothetical protein